MTAVFTAVYMTQNFYLIQSLKDFFTYGVTGEIVDDLEKIASGLKAATLDIETTGLKADWGFIVCACLKEVKANSLTGPTHVFRADNYRGYGQGVSTDIPLVRDLVHAMDGYDLILTWYGSQFDIPFINARSMKHDIIPPKRNFRRDLCFASRGNLAITSHSLANVARLMFGKTEKTRTEYETWLRAIRADKKAIDYIVDHCEKDVLETEKIYKRFTPLLGKLRRG